LKLEVRSELRSIIITSPPTIENSLKA